MASAPQLTGSGRWSMTAFAAFLWFTALLLCVVFSDRFSALLAGGVLAYARLATQAAWEDWAHRREYLKRRNHFLGRP